MDSLTQAVLGASITGSMLGRYHGRKAVIAGAVLATLPDLDVFIQYADPISSMTFHRGFTHSLFVLTAFSLCISVLWRLIKPDPRYSFSWFFMATWLCLVTHPLLDAFTSFGTQLWWPLNPTPTAWASIFIIDPLYTLPLVWGSFTALFLGYTSSTQRWLKWGLLLSSCYLALTVGAKHWAEHRALKQFNQQGIHADRVFSTNAPFNALLWRVMIQQNQSLCEMSISLLDQTPSEWLCTDSNRYLAQAVDHSEQVQRLRWFTDDWVRFDVHEDLLIVTDVRLGAAMGLHSFRFVVAEQSPEGVWETVPPYRWPQTVDFSLLTPLMQRIYQQQPPLPIRDWVESARIGPVEKSYP